MSFTQRLNKAPLWAKVVGIGVIGLLGAPIAMLVVKGLFGLMLAIVIALIGVFGFPVLIEALKIGSTKALTGLWASNPIPTLQNQYRDKVELLGKSREALAEFIAKVNNYRSRVQGYKQRFPKNQEKHKMYDEQYRKFFDLQQLKERKYEQTRLAVERFGEVVIEAEAEWDMAQAARDVNLADDFNNDPMEMLKARTALDAVQTAMNTAFAELDIALLEEPRFEDADGDGIIDVNPVPLKIPEAVKLQNK